MPIFFLGGRGHFLSSPGPGKFWKHLDVMTCTCNLFCNHAYGVLVDVSIVGRSRVFVCFIHLTLNQMNRTERGAEWKRGEEERSVKLDMDYQFI